MRLEIHWRTEDGERLPTALWRTGPGYRMISSGVTGGGIGPRDWVLNAQVPGAYSRTDPVAHLTEIAGSLGLAGSGVGMLTAAQVTDVVQHTDGPQDGNGAEERNGAEHKNSAEHEASGVHVAATVGLRVPTWAAASPGAHDPELAPAILRPGTINIVVVLPVPLSDAAYVNAVTTATEAKSQAIIEAGFAGTGTATDAICVAAPAGGGTPEDFTGPRSPWGARIARAVHAAVSAGAANWALRIR